MLLSDDAYACRLAVEGAEVTLQILDWLSRGFAFKSSEPMVVGVRPTQWIFRIAYNSQLSRRQLINRLSAMPGILLTVSPNGA